MTSGPRAMGSLSPTNLGNQSEAMANDAKTHPLFANLQARPVYLGRIQEGCSPRR